MHACARGHAPPQALGKHRPRAAPPTAPRVAGGPIWWGSTHRVHHKHCDDDRDPHSPIKTSPAQAFSFFEDDRNKWVHEEVRLHVHT